MLTRKQHELICFIDDRLNQTGVSPSFEEMKDALDLKSKSGVFSSYLAENEDQFVYSVADPSKGKFSQTAYTVIKETPALSLVKIKLLTGRKNQIRVQFTEHGHPVVGDPKYGPRDPFRERLCLHAKSIAFDHPHSGKRLFFDTPVPELFARLAGGLEEAEWQRAVVRAE